MSEDAGPGSIPPGEGDAFEELRRLLGKPEQDAIREILQRLDDPDARAEEIAEILADAFSRATGKGEALGKALAPTVEESLQVSIRRDPRAIADAISPIMGPAIRRSILQAIGGMVQSLNRTVEQSFSIQGLKWRLEAARSGRPFGEVVALKTLQFQVEQVFLIHRETGLLLAHRSVWRSTDPDLIGSMLVAIRDFVSDSFDEDGSGTGSLDTVQVGERTLWIETGRDAIIAGLVRGNAPLEMRETLLETLEQVEVTFGEALGAYDGDDAGLEEAGVYLQECLLSRGREDEAERGRPGAVAIGGWAAVGLALLTWLVLDVRDRIAFSEAVEGVRAEPGWVVLDADRGGPGWTLEVLRDPLARTVEEVLESSDELTLHARPYQSGDSAIVLQRLRGLVSAPDANLQLADGVVLVGGQVEPSVFEALEAIAPSVAGVREVRMEGSFALPTSFQRLASDLPDLRVPFRVGQSTPDAVALEGLIERLRSMDATLDRTGWSVRIVVTGGADPGTGSETTNRRLARSRATAVVEALGADWEHLSFEVEVDVPSEVESAPESARVVRLRVVETVR